MRGKAMDWHREARICHERQRSGSELRRKGIELLGNVQQRNGED